MDHKFYSAEEYDCDYIINNYQKICDDPKNEIESPAQAWNSICIGAFTNLAQLPDTVNGMPLAPSGDLSPSSRTASWSSHWPLKPDVVLEGGNWVIDEFLPPLGHESLSLLSTHRDYPNKSLE